METSQPGQLTATNWKAIGKSALLTMGGALVAFLAAQIEVIDWSTLGQYGYIIAPVAAFAINFFRLWLGKQES